MYRTDLFDILNESSNLLNRNLALLSVDFDGTLLERVLEGLQAGLRHSRSDTPNKLGQETGDIANKGIHIRFGISNSLI
jgi:hypothetical protein